MGHRLPVQAGACAIRMRTSPCTGFFPRTPYCRGTRSPDEIRTVRAAVRMKMLLNRLREIDPGIPDIDADNLDHMSEADLMKISLAKSSLANTNVRGLETPLLKANHGELHPVPSHSWIRKDMEALKEILFASYINLLLVVVPVALVAGVMQWGAVPVFFLNFLALVPLSLILGDITEDLALRFGDVRNLFTVVATSLLSIYSQPLGFVIPTLAGNIIPGSEAYILPLSRGSAIILLLTYCCYLYFHLFTHQDSEETDEPGADRAKELELPMLSSSTALTVLGIITIAVAAKELEMPMLTTFTALTVLGIITIIVALHSDYLTGALEEVSKETGLGQAFLGMIVLPIAGNACEHMTAVMVAMKNKMDLSLGIAVGSSLQIALFAIPVVVLAGWITGHDFSLNFDFFSVIVLLLR
eukprot:gene21146-28035_t